MQAEERIALHKRKHPVCDCECWITGFLFSETFCTTDEVSMLNVKKGLITKGLRCRLSSPYRLVSYW